MLLGTLVPLLAAPALLLGVLAPAPARTAAADVLPPAAVTWEIDASHSDVTFRIRHLVSRVGGTFNQFGGTIVADPQNLAGGSVNVTIQTASIDTNNERRDNHLRSADFFDAATHPTITFRSTRVEPQSGGRFRLHGDLAMKGVTKPVVLEGQMLAVGGAPGKRRIGFEATGTINRMDYGVTWNRAAEGGGAVLGDEVQVTIAIEAVEKA